MDAISGLPRNATGSAIIRSQDYSATSVDKPTVLNPALSRRPSNDPPPTQPSAGTGVAQEVVQALKSLGVDLTGSDRTLESTEAAGSGIAVREALGDFMKHLLDAAHTAGSADGEPAQTGPREPGSGFTNGLGSLITQVGKGAVPPALQASYDGLMQRTGTRNAPGLQQFLTQLQSQLGYAATPPALATGSVGNLLHSTA